MSGGYTYGEHEPREKCPYCGTDCVADFVDVGVGYIQCGPYHCERCDASQIGPNDEDRELTPEEKDTGWYRPGSPAGSSANVDHEGKHIRYFEADTLYRAGLGVAPRYDRRGRLIGYR